MSLNSTLISLVPFEISENKPGLFPPRYHISASDMKTPSLLKISRATHYVYLDQSRGSLPVVNPADFVAKAICEDYISSQLGVDDESRPALFWDEDDLNVEQIMIKHKINIVRKLESQKKWFLNVVVMADNDWNKYHQHNMVSSFQRRCADILGWNPNEHEWMAPMTTMESSTCPFCGTLVPKGFSRCGNCKEVVNPRLEKEIQAHMAVL